MIKGSGSKIWKHWGVVEKNEGQTQMVATKTPKWASQKCNEKEIEYKHSRAISETR